MSKNKPITHEKIAIKRMLNDAPLTTQSKSLGRIVGRIPPHNVKRQEDYNPLVPKNVSKKQVTTPNPNIVY